MSVEGMPPGHTVGMDNAETEVFFRGFLEGNRVVFGEPGGEARVYQMPGEACSMSPAERRFLMELGLELG